MRKDGTYFGNLVPADLARGQHGELLIGTADSCNALNEPSQSRIAARARADTYHLVSIILPGGGSLNDVKVTFDTACGVEESQLGVQPPNPSDVSNPPGSPQSLEATITVPSRIRSGTTLRYVVSLYNPETRSVTWRSCPNYTESILVLPLGGGVRRFTRTYELDCARAATVLPGHAVTFDMSLWIGRTARSANAKFSWQLDTGGGPFAGRGLYVGASS
ncbi:MAG: hypothetical protein KGJ36_07565 [Acidobacteriota bacterium]|nr:hypothetical protein [Acidobacteriota bacterium]